MDGRERDHRADGEAPQFASVHRAVVVDVLAQGESFDVLADDIGGGDFQVHVQDLGRAQRCYQAGNPLRALVNDAVPWDEDRPEPYYCICGIEDAAAGGRAGDDANDSLRALIQSVESRRP